MLPGKCDQMHLFLHGGAYWLTWGLRSLMPRRSFWRVAQFDMGRLRSIKPAVRIEALKTQARLHLPRIMPDHANFAWMLNRMPRLTLCHTGRSAPVLNRPRPTPMPSSRRAHPTNPKEADADLCTHSFRLGNDRPNDAPKSH